MVRIAVVLLFLVAFVPHAGQARPEPGRRVVKAERFVLCDPEGRVRAELGQGQEAPTLTLYDTKGTDRVSLAVSQDGIAQLALKDREGKNRIVLAVHPDGAATLDVPQPHNTHTITPVSSPATAAGTPSATRPAATAEGDAALYRSLCAGCHGSDGKGARMRPSYPTLPNFTSPAWQVSRSDAQLLAGILHGKGADMPAFDERLNRDKAHDLVAYIRHFAPGVARRDDEITDDFDRRLKELQRHWDELHLQLEKLTGHKE
jgi:mono/diheme cytochrome c family protein